jgi:transposase
MKKKEMSRDILYQKHYIECKSHAKIAEELECSKETIKRYLDKFQIIKGVKPPKSYNEITKEYLYEEYIIKKRSAKYIAKYNHLAIPTVKTLLKNLQYQ